MTTCNYEPPTFNPNGPCIEPIEYRVDVNDMLTGESLATATVPASVIEGESTFSHCDQVHADSFWRRIMKAAGIV